jgi:hypothetical protein
MLSIPDVEFNLASLMVARDALTSAADGLSQNSLLRHQDVITTHLCKNLIAEEINVFQSVVIQLNKILVFE